MKKILCIILVIAVLCVPVVALADDEVPDVGENQVEETITEPEIIEPVEPELGILEKPFDEYSVVEGLLLLIFIVICIRLLLALFDR